MPISWNEIRANAIAFSKEWMGETREKAEAKSFWDEFFGVFGLRRRHVAAFEAPVKDLSGNWGYIDLFWRGTLIVEHKSRGKDLSKANVQAMEYIRGLVDSGRGDEVPRYVIVSDFEKIALHDLADAPDLLLTKRTKPISPAPEILYGSMMIDKARSAGEDEGLVITEVERTSLLAESPGLKGHIRKLLGGEEFINGSYRWCLWLVDAPPELLRESPRLRARLEKVRKFRLGSGRDQTRNLAATPALFGEIRQPTSRYLLIPKVSSETRRYIPIGFIAPAIIASGSALIVPNATLYDFGVISSAMHNAWMRYVGGRLESRYQYSNQIVYNNFVWPKNPTAHQKAAVEKAAEAVLAARKQFPNTSLADLYDPVTTPRALSKAHAKLDRAVDRCYRPHPFDRDRLRVEFLFGLFEKASAPLVARTEGGKGRNETRAVRSRRGGVSRAGRRGRRGSPRG
ncbi:MAG: hypothetical protein HY719_02110 [Planctomycetes bacterium]|nr:hypothetical protein [Planctomycetota bacterium]